MQIDKNTSTLNQMLMDKAKITEPTKIEKHDKNEKNEKHEKTKKDLKDLKIQDILSFIDRENAKLIRHYGSEVYIALRLVEEYTIFSEGFLKRHKIESDYR